MRIVTHNPDATGKGTPIMSVTDDKNEAVSFYYLGNSPYNCYVSYVGSLFNGPNIVVKQPGGSWTEQSRDVTVEMLSTGRIFIAIGSESPQEITIRCISPDTSGLTGQMAFEAIYWSGTLPSYSVNPAADQALCLINVNGTQRLALRMQGELFNGGSEIRIRFYLSDNLDGTIDWDFGHASPVRLTSSTYTDGVGAYTAQEVAAYVESSDALAQMVDNSVVNHVSDIGRKYTSC